MSFTPQIIFVVAAAENGVIGRGGEMPWRLPSDLKRFKALTLNKPIIMGRKTFQSIGRPLPGRTNIVLTRDAEFRAQGTITTTSATSAMDIARGDAMRRGAPEIAVIGGADIFALYLDRGDRIELTRVHAAPDGDAHFAMPDPSHWQEISRERHSAGAGDSADFSYLAYQRRSAG